ncbi:MAG: ABC transporter ATPase [Sphingobacteriales bacterium]|nr:MAG: ABC transporter ATPase [Sphingobacteriales bacterium]
MKINPSSKIWIYQADRLFTNLECNKISTILINFTQNWQAHGTALSSGFEIRYNLFLILWVDEDLAGASGCSIDASVRVIKQIEQEFGVDLFNRFNMAYKENDTVKTTDRANFEKLLTSKTINPQTIVFNNLVNTYNNLQNNWEIPIANSWHSKVFTV